MDRYICIHAHFYQPPRENPWLETVEYQESAYPYHDWNERITAECYAPNCASRILDAKDHIREIVNNYSKISFNFGPTLLSWMQDKAPETYRCIIDSDRQSQQRFSGHGSALAQAYSHIILPLANSRDKYTQVCWGIRDFERRFGHAPEGMWLPETAVDLETLDILAQHGIKFTILAPRQAGKTRKIGGRSWKDVSGARIDPSRAYLAKLPSGRKINLFFYDGPISQSVAFEKLLNSGEQFADRLESGFSDARDWPQLVHIATDGETYGHHHRYGEMALSYALHRIESQGARKLTNYGEFLEKFPPTYEVQIIENTSWSCIHGVERWRANCGCNAGHPGWNQEWRGPLRAALDFLRDETALLFKRHAGELLRDPWNARNDYIEVILERSPESLWLFFEKHSCRPLTEEETVKVLKLLEMQRHAMLMYTSCGWFFDEISGIETVQVLQYAGRVIQMAAVTTGVDLESAFVSRLANAPGNIAKFGNGAEVYETLVRPALVNLHKVGAHFAISSIFEGSEDRPKFCYQIKTLDYHRLDSHSVKLAAGRIRVTSEITRDSREVVFGVVHMDDQILHAGVRDFASEEDYRELIELAQRLLVRGEFAELLTALDQRLDGMKYSLKSMFKDEQKRILNLILSNTLKEAETSFYRIYQQHGPLLRFLHEMQQPIPAVLRVTSEFVINTDLKNTFEHDPVDPLRISMLLELAKREGIKLEEAGIAYAASNALTRMMRRLRHEPADTKTLVFADILVTLLQMFPFNVNYWEAQNIFYSLLKHEFPRISEDHGSSLEWRERFMALGEKLRVSVPALEPVREMQMAG